MKPRVKELAPGEQIWANVGEIIRDQIPDKNGKTIPPDVTMGSYELRDLDHIGVGYLCEGKLVMDKGWGHGYYGCAGCCGYETPRLNPDPQAGAVSTGQNDTAEALDACTISWTDVTSEAYAWASTNSGIVNVANAYSKFVSPGGVTGSAQVKLQEQMARLNCPVTDFEPQNTQNAVSLTCSPTTVSWGGTVTCTVSGASASQVSQWEFAGEGVSVNGPTGVLTWSGPMVASGTITATAMGASPTQTITVSARSTYPGVALPAPTLVANGSTVNGVTLPTLGSPPTTEEGSFGQSAYAFGFDFTSGAASSGPNAGIYYVTSFADSSQYAWELNPGLTNSNDPFYQHQGNCFPSISQIVAAVQSHEVGLPGPSHYSEVQASLASDNPGSVANSYFGAQSGVKAALQAPYQAAFAAGRTEPPTNLPANINYPPYRTCP